MLVFQYGSNILDEEVNSEQRLRGDAQFVGLAYVEGYRLSFTVFSERRNCAAADLMPAEGSKVWGALYEVPDWLVYRDQASQRGRRSLDEIEGEGTNYRRMPISVRCQEGNEREALTYVVIEPRPGLTTSSEYASLILRGLRQRGTPEGYILEVKAIVRGNNPTLEQAIEAL